MQKDKLNQKYFVNQNSQLSIQCHVCKKSRTFPLETLRDKQHTLKVKCPCNNTFMIDIEFRKHYRKKVNFTGSYRLATATLEEEKCCSIKDLSLGGLSIKIINDETIRKSDELIVRFRIGDNMQHDIQRKIKVHHVDPEERIGGEFIESGDNGKEDMLLLYLL